MPLQRPPGRRASRRSRALLIEANPRKSAEFADGLRRHGFEVDTAPTGCLGDELAATCSFDVIVIDAMMPDLDGVTVCRNRGRSACGRRY